VTSPIIIAVVGAVVFLGVAVVVMSRADRRRVSRYSRLRTLVTMGSRGNEPALPLRRPTMQRTARELPLVTAARARLEAAFAQTGDRIGMPHLAVTMLIAATVTALFAEKVMRLNLAVVLVLGVAAGLATPALLLRIAQNRYRSQFLDGFPDALDLISRAVTAGLPVLDATEVATREIPAPVGSELRRTIEEMRIGVDIDEAMQRTADRIRVPDFRFFVVALKLQRRTGGGLAETLTNLSYVIRRRKEIRLKARALSSESKASAFVLALLPFAVGGVIFLINPDLASVLLTDPRGRFVMGLAFLSQAIGVITMAIVINKSLR
jgi:tight adherence protein B